MYGRALDIAESYKNKQAWQAAYFDVLPQFLSPHHWKLVISYKGQYHVSYVNVMKDKASPASIDESASFITKVRAYYKPVSQLNWLVHARYGKQTVNQVFAKEIWSLDAFRDIRHFMKFPALDRIEQRADGK